MIFDWNKAAKRIAESGCKTAYAGLKEDYDVTAGLIFDNGTPVASLAYLFSRWATPVLELDGKIEPCFLTDEEDTTDWDENTMWPESAFEILRSYLPNAENVRDDLSLLNEEDEWDYEDQYDCDDILAVPLD